MLLQRLRNSSLLVVGCRSFASSTEHRKPKPRQKSGQFKSNSRSRERPTIPEFNPEYITKVFVTSDFPALRHLELDNDHDRGITGDVLKTSCVDAVKDGQIIDSLRKCNQFEAGRNYIEHILSSREKLAASGLIEAAKFFPLAALHSKCNPDVDKKLMEKIELHVKDWPQSIMTDTVRFYLSAGKSACSGFVDKVPLEEFDFRKILFRKDCFSVLAFESLVLKDIERFKLVTEQFADIAGSEIRSSKELLKYFCDFLKLSDAHSSDQLREFFFTDLIGRMQEVSLEEYTYQFQPVLNVLQSQGWKVTNSYVYAKSRCDICGEKLQKTDELSHEEFESLKCGISDMVEGLSKTSKSGSLREMKHLQRLSEERISESGPLLVVDFLNFVHNYWNNLDRVFSKINELLNSFAHIMIITRSKTDQRFLQRLKPLPVSVFFCDQRSEDDLFVLLAAMQRGPDTHIITNDLYNAHRSRLEPHLAGLFDRWMRQRAVRFNNRTLVYQLPPSLYSNTVQRSQHGFHVPILTRRGGGIPQHTWMCLQKK